MNKVKTIFSIALLSMLLGMNATAAEKGATAPTTEKAAPKVEKATAKPTTAKVSSEKTLSDSFKDGKFKGQAAVYYEVHDRDKSGGTTGDSFAVGTLKLKYETAKWNNIQFGAELFAASQLYDHGNEYAGDFDKANGDDNTLAALSEIYIKYNFGKKSFIKAGRYSHKKTSHFDDAQSEGAFIQYNEIEDLSVNFGFMTKFAELDYDDFEDFGDSGSEGGQDLSDDKYGDSDDFVVYLDADYKISDSLSINPYLYHQGDYASVLGSELTLKGKLSENTKIGTTANFYTVETDGDLKDTEGSGSQAVSFHPWVKFGNLKLGTGVAYFTEGVAKPAWFKDYLGGFDQENEYPGASATDESTTAIQGTVEYKYNNFKVRYGIQQWDTANEELEQELIFGYKFTKALDLSLRLFAVDQTGSDDYNKMEARLRFKF